MKRSYILLLILAIILISIGLILNQYERVAEIASTMCMSCLGLG